jgi:ribonuclease III
LAALPDIEQRIGYRFTGRDLLRAALTHRSHGAHHNERLEFLGDSLLNLTIAMELFTRFPKSPEGDLSRLRAALVKKQALYEVAQEIALGDVLLLGEGELRSGGFRRPSILADALEALIGAVLVDGGLQAARDLVCRLFASRLDGLHPNTLDKDPKTRLQELLQGRHLALPSYNVIAITGAAHDQRFRVACSIADCNISTEGEGPSRRAAEMQAAERACGLIQGG